MDSFLLIGQSNMCGRGIIGQVPPIDPRGMMYMLRNGRWQPMSEPINPDRRVYVDDDTQIRSGVSLAASFAESYANTYGREIGLIPCAEGGSKLLEWQPGEILLDHAIMQARLAQRSSNIAGILWHQGEGDSLRAEDCANYVKRFFTMLDHIIKELNLNDELPVVLGELSLLGLARWPLANDTNGALHEIAKLRPRTGVASQQGLTLTADGMHFDSASYRELGRRYFSEYKRIRGDAL